MMLFVYAWEKWQVVYENPRFFCYIVFFFVLGFGAGAVRSIV
jgi:hypothetical protein